MSLFIATLLPGILLLITGILLLWNNPAFERLAKKSLRSSPITFLLMGLGSAWFLYEVTQLGAADFGHYRHILFILFFGIAFLSFIFVKDYLAVRGAVILVLMCARVLLDAAYMQEPAARLFMVSFVYLCIIIALYLGVVPYRVRDFFNWLFTRRSRTSGIGSFITLYGLLLCVVAFSY